MIPKALIAMGFLFAGPAWAQSLSEKQIGLIKSAGLDAPGPEAVALAASLVRTTLRLPDGYRQREVAEIRSTLRRPDTNGAQRSCDDRGAECRAALDKAANEIFDRWVSLKIESETARWAAVVASGMDAEQMRQVRSFVETPAGSAFIYTALAMYSEGQSNAIIRGKLSELKIAQARQNSLVLKEVRDRFTQQTASLPRDARPVAPQLIITPTAPYQN